MKRKVLLLLMVMILLLGIVTPAYGGNGPPSSAQGYELVSLGDSTAVGTRLVPTGVLDPPFMPAPILDGSPGEDYCLGGYYDLLIKTPLLFESSISHAIDGKDTKDILRDLLRDNKIRKDVRKAKEAVVLSVGGNDLLGRVMDAAYEYGQENYPLIPLPDPLTYQNKLIYFAALADELINPGIEFGIILQNAKLHEGVIGFGLRYPRIIRTMTRLNSDVDFYALTIFNPMQEDETYGPLLDQYIEPMNEIIRLMASSYDNVHLVEVHDAFEETPGSVLFDPFGTGYIDPHATTIGHVKIYELILIEMGISP